MKTKKNIFVVAALLLFVVAGCATTPEEKTGQEAVLFNPVVAIDALEVSVVSNGCTKPEHFYLLVGEDNLIELRRTKEDMCRAAPKLVRYSFEYGFGDAVYEFKNEVRYSNRVTR